METLSCNRVSGRLYGQGFVFVQVWFARRWYCPMDGYSGTTPRYFQLFLKNRSHSPFSDFLTILFLKRTTWRIFSTLSSSTLSSMHFVRIYALPTSKHFQEPAPTFESVSQEEASPLYPSTRLNIRFNQSPDPVLVVRIIWQTARSMVHRNCVTCSGKLTELAKIQITRRMELYILRYLMTGNPLSVMPLVV